MSRRLLAAAPLLAAAALVPAQALSAQTSGSISLGETVNDRLSSTDPTDQTGSHYRDYTLDLREGQRFTVELRSPEFDTYLRLYRSDAGRQVEIASDDDGGGGFDSRLRMDLDAPATYVVRVTSYGSGETGAFTLAVQRPPEVIVEPARPISDGETLQGQLTVNDPTHDGRHYDDFTFEAEAGQRVRVSVRAGHDSYLYLGRGTHDDFQEITTDDDGGDGLDSSLLWVVPSTGTYTVRASSFGQEVEGPYQVSLQRLPDPVTADPEAYPGGRIQGVLELTDAQGMVRGYGMEEAFYDEWIVRGRAGERLVISLASTSFDSFLQFGRGTGDDFQEIKSDDDGGANLNSLLAIVLPFDGTYTVRVSSVGDFGEGRYELDVESDR